eukprot:1955894-Alexandrium_andersonii.AAC.1
MPTWTPSSGKRPLPLPPATSLPLPPPPHRRGTSPINAAFVSPSAAARGWEAVVAMGPADHEEMILTTALLPLPKETCPLCVARTPRAAVPDAVEARDAASAAQGLLGRPRHLRQGLG